MCIADTAPVVPNTYKIRKYSFVVLAFFPSLTHFHRGAATAAVVAFGGGHRFLNVGQ